MKIPIVLRDNYTIYIEWFNNLVFIHTDVFKWTAEVKKNYIRDLNLLQSLLNLPLYGLVDNDKLGKFGESIGFKFVKTVIGDDGNTYQIYLRSL
jgi:hypothetical protein